MRIIPKRKGLVKPKELESATVRPSMLSDSIDEHIADTVGAMFSGNTETFITVTYQDSDNTIDLVVPVKDEDNMASNSDTFLATQQSIKAYVDSLTNVAASDTFPTSPFDGMLFVHDTTGRKILYVYDLDNTTWVPIESIGTMTLYVDSSDGTDDLTHGTGVDSDAFATVQYAVDVIPPIFSGNVTVNINAETYAETVTIRGKKPTGNYTITLQGTLSSSSSGTQSANGTQGTGATQGAFTDAGNLAGVAGKLAYLDADGDYKIIDSTDGNTATCVGYFTSQPLQNENYVIYDWGTTINELYFVDTSYQLNVYDIHFQGDTGVTAQITSGTAVLYRCKITASDADAVNANNNATSVGLNTCYVTSNVASVYCFQVINMSYGYITGCKLENTNDNGRCMAVTHASYGKLVSQNVIDGVAGGNKAQYGLEVFAGARCSCENAYQIIRNCDTGVIVYYNSAIMFITNNQYSGNTTDESIGEIVDNAILMIDQSDAASGEYFRATTNGAESRSSSEHVSDVQTQLYKINDTTDQDTYIECTEDAITEKVANATTRSVSSAGIATLPLQPAATAWSNTAQVIATGSAKAVLLDSTDFDVKSEFDTTKKTGAADGTVANHLQDDTNSQFTSADVGRFVWNTTDNTYATITAYNDAGDVTLDADIMVNGENYILYDGRYTATEAGKYLVIAKARVNNMGAAQRFYASGIKNSTTVIDAEIYTTVGSYESIIISGFVNMAANDVLTFKVYPVTSNETLVAGALNHTYMSVCKIC